MSNIEPLQVEQEIKKLTDLFGFKIPIDGLMTAINHRKIVDIVALDEKLMKTFSNDYEDGMSMSDFIETKFGKDTLKSLEIALGFDE